jgi:hypothetical protein
MEKDKNVFYAIYHYEYIKHSRVSWTRKSTYKKKIKRRISKLRRNLSKKLTKQLIHEKEYNIGY